MKGPTRKQSIGLGLTPLQVIVALSGFVVVVGLMIESGPELLHSLECHVWPRRDVTGSALVTVGVFLEVALAIFIERSATRAALESEVTIAEARERAAHAEQAAAEANLARMKIEEQLFKPHVLTDEAQTALIEVLNEYAAGRKRADVFLYDSHLHDVFQLGLSINATFKMAGWTSGIWIGKEPRMEGLETTFGIARECLDPKESQALQRLAAQFTHIFRALNVTCATCINCFSTADRPLTGWAPWSPSDAALFRVQIGQRQLSSDLIFRPTEAPKA